MSYSLVLMVFYKMLSRHCNPSKGRLRVLWRRKWISTTLVCDSFSHELCFVSPKHRKLLYSTILTWHKKLLHVDNGEHKPWTSLCFVLTFSWLLVPCSFWSNWTLYSCTIVHSVQFKCVAKVHFPLFQIHFSQDHCSQRWLNPHLQQFWQCGSVLGPPYPFKCICGKPEARRSHFHVPA